MNGKPRAGTGARLGDASNTCIPGNGKKERVRSCLRTNDDIGDIVSFDLALDASGLDCLPSVSSRPQPAGQPFPNAVIGMAAALQNLPDEQFVLLGQSGRWRCRQCRAAMWRSTAVQPLKATNDCLSLRATAGPDPLLSFDVRMVRRWLPM